MRLTWGKEATNTKRFLQQWAGSAVEKTRVGRVGRELCLYRWVQKADWHGASL